MNMINREFKNGFFKACEAIEGGRLYVRTPEGERHVFGEGELETNFELKDWRAIAMTLSRGDIGFGEAYVDGLWNSDSPEDFLTLVLKSRDRMSNLGEAGAFNQLKFQVVNNFLRRNSRKGSRHNIRAHYDVGNEFYMLWLDESMSYSSAIVQDGDELYDAQMRKYDRILDKLGNNCHDILEIGCGWGGFAERAANRGHFVTGLTISPAQKGYADARLDGDADIQLCDYRDSKGQFDHIVSIEMIEAVGQSYWPTYFSTLKARLKPEGKAMIQAITVPNASFDHYRKRSDFIRHYTFPGGMLLSDEQIEIAAKNAGLQVQDSFAFGKDYAWTCRNWSQQLVAKTEQIYRLGYDEKFLRSWRYYLDACTASFEVGNANVVQVELTHA